MKEMMMRKGTHNKHSTSVQNACIPSRQRWITGLGGGAPSHARHRYKKEVENTNFKGSSAKAEK